MQAELHGAIARDPTLGRTPPETGRKLAAGRSVGRSVVRAGSGGRMVEAGRSGSAEDSWMHIASHGQRHNQRA